MIPVSLLEVKPYDSHYTEDFFMGSYGCSTDSQRTDTYNNLYQADNTAGLICGYRQANFSNDVGGRMTFINEGYVRFTGTLAYDRDGKKSGIVYFRVYDGNKLKYDSGMITDNTEPINFEIDVTDCHMITIFWGTATKVEAKAWGETTNGQGTIILNNPLLYKY